MTFGTFPSNMDEQQVILTINSNNETSVIVQNASVVTQNTGKVINQFHLNIPYRLFLSSLIHNVDLNVVN